MLLLKRILGVIVVIVLVFIILMYWSLNIKPKTIKTSRLVNIANINSINFKEHDSVLITATNQYKGNELKRIMQGEHYRKAWSTPIKAPIVFLDTLYGGTNIEKEGGGKQTESLTLLGSNGIYYTLRSIDKKPDALIPEIAKTLGLENIIIDGVSAQHPYGAIVVSSLAESAKILHSSPRVVFIPKQPLLGDYNENYGNRLFLLEYETESKVNWTGLKNVLEIIDTDDLQKLKKLHGERLQIDKNALVRARLFDLVIGDWDRHSKQWGWVIQSQGADLKAIPLPVDRDNAFFHIGGIIPNIIANKNVTPEMRPFKEDIDYLPGLVQSFDVYFLQDIPEEVFIKEAEELQKLLSDASIAKALKQWPKQLYDLDGREISEKIKSRRGNLVNYAKAFKKVLDEKPLLTEPLKGSEDLDVSKELLSCFGCKLKD